MRGRRACSGSRRPSKARSDRNTGLRPAAKGAKHRVRHGATAGFGVDGCDCPMSALLWKADVRSRKIRDQSRKTCSGRYKVDHSSNCNCPIGVAPDCPGQQCTVKRKLEQSDANRNRSECPIQKGQQHGNWKQRARKDIISMSRASRHDRCRNCANSAEYAKRAPHDNGNFGCRFTSLLFVPIH